MPFIGGMILAAILLFVIWLLSAPLFNKIGKLINKKYNQFKLEEENVNDEEY